MTIGADAGSVRRFDQFRKKRNLGAYERSGVVSDQEAKEMGQFARALRKDVEQWILAEHPELL